MDITSWTSFSNLGAFAIAFATCLSALAVVFSRNIVRAAVWLLFTLIGGLSISAFPCSSTAAQLFSGAKDAKAAYMAGQLKIDGPIPDALRFQEILTIVNEEIEY